MSELPPPRLRIDSYGRRFGFRTVLKSASAWARPGRITLLMGRNGCGKTTLLRCGLGLMQSDFGTLLFEDDRISGGLPSLAMRGVFYLPDRRLLSTRLTVRQHLQVLRERFDDRVNAHAGELMDVEMLMDSRPEELSGGERRRAEIWLASTHSPMCLIADEPLLGIAPKDRGLVAATLRRLAESGTALLVTGHEVEDLFELADEVIWMVAGTTHGLGTPSEASHHAQFRIEYLGTRAMETS